jgi:uncharacterized lipoprotein
MNVIAKSLLLSVTLVSCGTSEDSRYRDTVMLERPPAIAVNKQKGEPRVTDTSTIPKKGEEPGLGSDVYMTASMPRLLIIKQPFNVAWDTLGQALKQNDIKISDREHDKGHYYVTYDPDKQAAEEGNFFDKAMSFFDHEQNEGRYVLTVEDKGSKTQISAAINKEPRQSALSDNKDNASTQPTDGAEKLLLSLYKTMSDDHRHQEKKSGRHHTH